MAYRDEHEALRARLEATEERLRIAEGELAEAKRRLEEPTVLEPSAPPPSTRRVGYPPAAVQAHAQYGVMAAAVSGTILSLVGIAFLLWNLPGDEGLADIAATLVLAFGFGLAPGGGLLYFSVRTPKRRRSRVAALAPEPPRTRVAPPARVEVRVGSDDGESDGSELRTDSRRALSP
jgi:hypothetical protein